jgi:16S rRNA (adenine1518-N6/adenine1519-N6)-dimethyltransferase
VAERLAAPPGSRAFGRISLLVRYRARVDLLFRIGAAAFRPRPRVESAVVSLRFYDPLPVRAGNEKALFELARALFSGRRKMVRSGLKAYRPLSPNALGRLEELARVDLTARPEDLDVDAWCRLSDALEIVE